MATQLETGDSPARLTTKRLLLREYRDSDWRAIYEYTLDPEMGRYTGYGPKTPDEVRSDIRWIKNAARERPRQSYEFVIVRRSDRRLIGACNLPIRDLKLGEAEIGYEIDRRFWGHGYMTEAARALLTFGFQQLCLHRVTASCRPENAASRRVLEKIGMRQEAHFRENRWYHDRWWDTLLYALLDHEWRALSPC